MTDCIEAAAADCTGIDRDHRKGEFKVAGLEAGLYRLIETAAPAGYVLDETPRYIEVNRDTAFADPIENDQRDSLVIPFTGGMSAQMFTVVCGGARSPTDGVHAGASSQDAQR